MVEEKKLIKKKVAPKKSEEKDSKAVTEVTPEQVSPSPVPTEVADKVVSSAPKKKSASKKATASSSDKVALVLRGKRKSSVARAAISPGKGVVRFNRLNVTSLENKYVREIILEPTRYVGPAANEVDISVKVTGGGMMGQAQAARTAIANALVNYFPDLNLKDKFIDIDWSLIIEDTRRVESKKYRGPKARARFQKSYR
ncbi:30S ribosomal protein S9 [Candidatus Micrarchaeota archaeon]|nr:30S ribosomal protein S9 [Candidatus Micrarchaeota archaeon]